jgi:hypothetical protein
LVEHLERLGYSSLSGMIRAYANLIAQEHGITAELIFDSNKIVLIYYDKYVGIPSHIDNITYTTGGPIYAAGIGPASSLFDMIPATVDGIPVRLEVTVNRALGSANPRGVQIPVVACYSVWF